MRSNGCLNLYTADITFCGGKSVVVGQAAATEMFEVGTGDLHPPG